MIKIALNSPVMQSGKTTITNYLIKKYNFKKLTLAKTIKDMGIVLLKSLDIHHERIHYYTEIAKEEIITELGVSWRWICQSLGTEWGRQLINKEIWLKTLITQMNSNHNYVCEDVRFLNEADFYRNNGFKIIRVIKPDAKLIGEKHASEGELDNYNFDEVIYNNSTLDNLYKTVDKLIENNNYGI